MVAHSLRRAGMVAGAALTLALASGAPALAASGWTPVASMSVVHRAHVAVPLLDGKVLVISGFSGLGEVPEVERYDPATGTWSPAAPVLVPRYYASATRLNDGRILLAGGMTAGGVTNHAELYDPVANTWTVTGALNAPRNGHSAVLLRNGKVLVIGGADGARDASATGELYDPATGAWTTTADAMSAGRENLSAALLPDGRVLAAGGFDLEPTLAFHASADVYDPATDRWSPTASMATPRGQAATALLPGGHVLVAGGVNLGGFITAAETWDPATGAWSSAGTLPFTGNVMTAATLDDDRVLIHGDGSLTTALFDPATRAIGPAGATRASRALPSLTTLADGRALLAGGSNLSSVELFTPPTERTAVVPAFGTVAVGQAAERDVMVQNAGGNRLWSEGAAIAGANPGDFAIVADGCAGAELPPAGSCQVRVRFTPSAEGARTAELTFADNAEDSPTAPLSGVGEATRRRPPVDPGPVDPGPVDPGPPADPGPPPVRQPDPPADPGPPARPAAPRAGRAIERFMLARNCVRPDRAGIVRVDLRLELAELRPLELRIARGAGTKGLKRCPPPDPTRRFGGRLHGVRTVGALTPSAVVATVSGRRTVRLRLTPGLYRLTVRARRSDGRLSAPAHRWLRVIAPR